jgi:hypothetical protein
VKKAFQEAKSQGGSSINSLPHLTVVFKIDLKSEVLVGYSKSMWQSLKQGLLDAMHFEPVFQKTGSKQKKCWKKEVTKGIPP